MLSGLSEDQLVAALLSHLPPLGKGRGVIVGAGGDDCAVVKPPPRGHRLLLKTDCVIEGVHFLPDTPPEAVGWKALCRALSDLAATGGKPLHALVTFAVNPARTLDWATEIYTGLGEAARTFGVAVVGGETASTSGPSWISVAMTGSVRRDRGITRGGGRAGDVLFVTGQLGGSFASGKHLAFLPRVAEGQWLARRGGVRAMMDLSDGLAADLPRLAAASGTGYQIDCAALPLTSGSNVAHALGDGEDYELLVAVEPSKAERLRMKWQRRFHDLSLTAIGFLADQSVASGLDGARGYDHFQVPRK